MNKAHDKDADGETASLRANASADEPAPTGPFHALRFPNFRLFFYGQLISVAGTWMQTVALQWLVYELTKSATWLGIVAGAGSLPYVVFAAWGGAAADKYPRRSVLLWTQIAAMILAFVLAGLATNRVVKVEAWIIAVLTGLSGIVNAFNMPAQMAFVTDIVEDRKALGNAVALNSLRFNIARFLGPILAGVTLAKFGAAACFLLNGLSFLAVIWSLLLIKTPPFTPTVRERKFGEGLKFIVGIPSVLRVVLLFAAASLFTMSATTLFPVLAARYGQGATGYSLIFAVNGMGAALGGLAMATYADRFPRRVPFYAGAALSSIFLICLAFAPNFYAALVCLFFSGATMIAFAISANTKVQIDAPDHLRGRVMAVYALVANAFAPLGGLLIGFLAERFSLSYAIAANAALCLCITAGIFLWSRRDRPPPRDWIDGTGQTGQDKIARRFPCLLLLTRNWRPNCTNRRGAKASILTRL